MADRRLFPSRDLRRSITVTGLAKLLPNALRPLLVWKIRCLSTLAPGSRAMIGTAAFPYQMNSAVCLTS